MDESYQQAEEAVDKSKCRAFYKTPLWHSSKCQYDVERKVGELTQNLKQMQCVNLG